MTGLPPARPFLRTRPTALPRQRCQDREPQPRRAGARKLEERTRAVPLQREVIHQPVETEGVRRATAGELIEDEVDLLVQRHGAAVYDRRVAVMLALEEHA